MDAMKRAIIVTPYKNYPGGVEVFNNYIEQLLTKLGYEIVYCTSDLEKISVWSIVLKFIFGRPGITSYVFRKKKYQYDLCITNGEYCFGIPNKNCIVVFHNSLRGQGKALRHEIKLKNRISLFRGYIEQYLGSRKKYCISVSEFSRNDLEQNGIKVHAVIVNCVDTDIFTPENINNRKGYLDVAANDFFRKGLDILSKIASKLPEKSIDLLTNAHETINNINILFNVDNKKMPEVYNRYKIFVFPSRYEAMQIAPLEAMACGVPVVISNVGLGPKLKEKIPDFVVDGYDDNAINEYVEKIGNILENYNYYSHLAREYILEYHNKSVFFDEWEDVIHQVESNNHFNF
jgi:glycosyltransferase involved in cell wall biosynthesis